MKFIEEFKTWTLFNKIFFVFAISFILFYGLVMTGFIMLPGSMDHGMSEHMEAQKSNK